MTASNSVCHQQLTLTIRLLRCHQWNATVNFCVKIEEDHVLLILKGTTVAISRLQLHSRPPLSPKPPVAGHRRCHARDLALQEDQ
jgi:hypothetical protein